MREMRLRLPDGRRSVEGSERRGVHPLHRLHFRMPGFRSEVRRSGEEEREGRKRRRPEKRKLKGDRLGIASASVVCGARTVLRLSRMKKSTRRVLFPVPQAQKWNIPHKRRTKPQKGLD